MFLFQFVIKNRLKEVKTVAIYAKIEIGRAHV